MLPRPPGEPVPPSRRMGSGRTIVGRGREHQGILFEVRPGTFAPCNAGTDVWSFTDRDALDGEEVRPHPGGIGYRGAWGAWSLRFPGAAGLLSAQCADRAKRSGPCPQAAI